MVAVAVEPVQSVRTAAAQRFLVVPVVSVKRPQSQEPQRTTPAVVAVVRTPLADRAEQPLREDRVAAVAPVPVSQQQTTSAMVTTEPQTSVAVAVAVRFGPVAEPRVVMAAPES